jgi:hypothetical protein
LILDDQIVNQFQHVLRQYADEDVLSNDFFIFLCDLMKTSNNYISYSILKKKIASNLKNFKEFKFFNATEKLGSSTITKFK